MCQKGFGAWNEVLDLEDRYLCAESWKSKLSVGECMEMGKQRMAVGNFGGLGLSEVPSGCFVLTAGTAVNIYNYVPQRAGMCS